MPRKKIMRYLQEEDVLDVHCRVRLAVSKKLLVESEEKDAEQEVILHLIKNLSKFKPRKGNWTTYRGLLIRSKLRELIRLKFQPSSYHSRNASFSIDDPIPTLDGDSQDILWKDTINQDGVFADGTERAEEIERHNVVMDVRIAIAAMPRHLQKLCRFLMYSDGMTTQELSRKFNVTRKTLSSWRAEIKMFLELYGLGERF